MPRWIRFSGIFRKFLYFPSEPDHCSTVSWRETPLRDKATLPGYGKGFQSEWIDSPSDLRLDARLAVSMVAEQRIPH